MELDLSDSDLAAIEHDFVPSVRRLLLELEEHKKSLFLILDDINGLARSDDFANWLKSSVDEIATSADPTRLCILVVGLEERRRELVERQPSLARVFELIDIEPWSDDEVRDFFSNSFHLANATISENDLRRLVLHTGGLPVLAHEIGDAVWRAARTREIRTADVSTGIATAAEVIGRKDLEPGVLKAVRSARYRAILGRIAATPRTRFTRAELLKRLPDDEKRVLDALLRRMKALGALQSDPEVKGGYRFSNRLHALYFYTEARTRGALRNGGA